MAKKPTRDAARIVKAAAGKTAGTASKKASSKKTASKKKTDSALIHLKQSLRRAHDSGELFLSGESENLFCGIPLPSLSLMYLFGTTIWPLGRFMQFAGQEGSCKSSLLAEVSRWVCASFGTGTILETEAKDIAMLRNGILERKSEWINEALGVQFAGSLEGWMEGLNNGFDRIKTICEEYGWTAPVLYGIDSIVGAASRKVHAQVEKDGAPESNYPDTPRHLTTLLATVPDKIFKRPISIVGTNHLKPGQDRRGYSFDKFPGGKALAFYSTYIVRLKRLRYIEPNQKYGGVEIELHTVKNSAGQAGREINVQLLWKTATTRTGGTVYYAYWDWAAASIQMLVDRKKTSVATWTAINKVVDINIVEKQNKVWSKVLGIPEKKPVRFTTAGALLEQRGDLIMKLMPLLYISENPAFIPDPEDLRDYDEAIAAGPTPVTDMIARRLYHPQDLNEFADLSEALAAQPTVEELMRKAEEELDAEDDDYED